MSYSRQSYNNIKNKNSHITEKVLVKLFGMFFEKLDDLLKITFIKIDAHNKSSRANISEIIIEEDPTCVAEQHSPLITIMISVLLLSTNQVMTK